MNHTTSSTNNQQFTDGADPSTENGAGPKPTDRPKRRDYLGDGCQLSDAHLKLIVDSAISPEVARERRYRTIERKVELRTKYHFSHSQSLTPTLLIPLYGPDGKCANYQHRPDNPRINRKTGKPTKYETPAKSRVTVDIHPSLMRKRSRQNDAPYFDITELPSLIADPSVPLFITEGVRKGDSAVSIGLCCVALLGVWNWRGTNKAGGKVALPEWEDIPLNGRSVYIAFDSDVMVNPHVVKALIRLKAVLENREANVKMVYLPNEHGEKVGLDDFIAERKHAGQSDAEIRDAILTLARDKVRKVEDQGQNKILADVFPYRETEQGLQRYKITDGGSISYPLTNFIARITADIAHDDGTEVARAVEIEATLRERTSTFVVSVTAFSSMRWPIEQLGSGAILYAGQGTTDHARTAIQMLSKEHETRTVYTHTGWRQIDGAWMYLHAGGAIGGQGAVDGIEVSLPPALADFRLPAPPANPREAIRASLKVLDVGPDEITFSVYAATWRAILGGADFSIFEFGRTGGFKSALAALIQNHIGSRFTSDHLPANFTSSANFNEALAFAAQDAVLVVDEFRPPASGSEHDRMHRDAARLLRAQGNHQGRGRMRSDSSLRPEKPPRGLMLPTGEELPRGESLQARVWIVEVKSGDVSADKLTACQADAAAGLYAQATSAFIAWLAPQIDDVRKQFRAFVDSRRIKLKFGHPRTNDIYAQLEATYSIFTTFLLETGTVDEAEADALTDRAAAALRKVAADQSQFSRSGEPCGRFFDLLGSALATGQAHIADYTTGNEPEGRESACGWRLKTIGTGDNKRDEWQPQGPRIGWLTDADLYLDPEASYHAAQHMATSGEGIEVSATTLARRLREKGLLVSVDERRQRLTRRVRLQGRDHNVLHFSAKLAGLYLYGLPSKPSNGAAVEDGLP